MARNGARSCLDEGEFKVRLRILKGRLQGLGIRGQDAEDIALSMLVAPRAPIVVRSVSALDARSGAKTFRRSEQRRRRTEHAAARRRAESMVAGKLSALDGPPDMQGLLDDGARRIPPRDLQAFAHRLLERWRSDPDSVLVGLNGEDSAGRSVFANLIRRQRAQVTDLPSGPRIERIVMETLRLWEGGDPAPRHRRSAPA